MTVTEKLQEEYEAQYAKHSEFVTKETDSGTWIRGINYYGNGGLSYVFFKADQIAAIKLSKNQDSIIVNLKNISDNLHVYGITLDDFLNRISIM